MTIRFLPAGDTGLVVEFGDRIDRALSARVLFLAERMRKARIEGISEVVPTFRSLMVIYDPLVTGRKIVEGEVRKLLDQKGTVREKIRLWHVPTCYDEACAPDLNEVAEKTGMTTAEVVKRHSTTRFHVYTLGFVPGFPYMGDVPQDLALPRRHNPRVRVPAGSVAIAMNMTCVYPLETPGGWHLIGRTPIRLFDERAEHPALFSPGDAVRHEPVSFAEYERIREAVARADYVVPSDEIAAGGVS